MTDKYIDLDETQIYGPYASGAIRTRVLGLVAKLDTGLAFLADEIDEVTTAVGEQIRASRETSADVRAGTKDKGPVLERSLRVLGRFSKHLSAHADGAVDHKTYFPEDGTATGVGRSAPRVLVALGRINTELKKTTCKVRDKKKWVEEIAASMDALTPLVAHANNAKTERRAATPELESAREAWMQTYMAAKSGVECALRLSGNLHMMSTIFYDLAVPGSTKVTAPPPPPPPVPTGEPVA
jgi:hypothetical protein